MFDPEALGELPEVYAGRACATGFTVDGHSPESPCGLVCTPGSIAERGAWVDAARELVDELQTSLAQGVTTLGLGTRVQVLSNTVEGLHGRASIEDIAAAVQELRCIREDARAVPVTPVPPPTVDPTDDKGGGWTWPTLPTLPTFTWPSFAIPECVWWGAVGILAGLILKQTGRNRRAV